MKWNKKRNSKDIIDKLQSHISNSIKKAEEHKSKLNVVDYRVVPDERILHQLTPTRSDGTFNAELRIPQPKEGYGNYQINCQGAGVLQMGGMSSQKTRHFLNNLCSIEDWPIRYIEIGVWGGSTFISSGFMNDNNFKEMVAIDNFCQFNKQGDIKQRFMTNVAQYLKPNDIQYEIMLYEKNCFDDELLESLEGPYNIYFYDGPHTVEETYKSLSFYDKVLDDIFIYIVDDYQEKIVQDGAQQAIKDLGYKIHYEISLHGKGGSDGKTSTVPYYEHWRDEWWQGQYVAILEKPKSRKRDI